MLGVLWGFCVLIMEEIDGVFYCLVSGVVDFIVWIDLRLLWELVVFG